MDPDFPCFPDDASTQAPAMHDEAPVAQPAIPTNINDTFFRAWLGPVASQWLVHCSRATYEPSCQAHLHTGGMYLALRAHRILAQRW